MERKNKKCRISFYKDATRHISYLDVSLRRNMSRLYRRTICFSFLFFSSSLLLRAEVTDSLTRALDEVVVTASRMEKETIPVQELSGEGLKRLSVYSVADALRYFAGLQIKDYGGIGGLKTVNVRSLGSQHVGVFYDGIQLGNAQNGVIDLGRFSLDNMEAVTLYNGQKSAIFQSAKDYASASALYLQTRRPRRNGLNIGFKGGSFDTYNPSLLWEQRLDSAWAVSVSTEYMQTSGRYPFRIVKKDGYDTTMVRQNGDVRALRAEVALFGDKGRDHWMAKAYLYDSGRGYPGAAVREAPGTFTHQDRQWDTNTFVQASWRRAVSWRYTLQAQAKYAYDYLHYRSDPRLDVSTMYIDNTFRQQEVYASTSHLVALTPWWNASAAADIQMNTLDADLTGFVYPTRYTLLAAASTQMEWGGLKVQGSALFTHVDDHVRNGNGAGQRERLTPALVASWRPFHTTDWHLRAFYKRIFRMPTLNDLYYTFIGNANLKPENTIQYNIGTTLSLPLDGFCWDVQADAYYNEVENKIVAMPASNQFRWTMINLGYVEIRGLDVAVQGSFVTSAVGHALRLTYTFQQAQDKTDATSPWYGGQIPYIPCHSGSVIYSGDYGLWNWNYSFIYTGERYEAIANIPENYAQPWYTHDVSFSRLIPLRLTAQSELRLSLEVNNLLNQAYEVVQCYPMPGRNWKLKANLLL
jgi:Outer membrane cobalamin receptor protein